MEVTPPILVEYRISNFLTQPRSLGKCQPEWTSKVANICSSLRKSKIGSLRELLELAIRLRQLARLPIMLDPLRGIISNNIRREQA